MIPAIEAAERQNQSLSSQRQPVASFTPRSGDFGLWGATPATDGIYVTEQSALTLSAFWAGVTLICEAMASMPLKVFRRRDDGGWDYADNHPVNYITTKTTNGWVTPSVWKSFEQSCCLLSGNAVCEIVRNFRGQAVELNHWLPCSTQFGIDHRNKPMYGVISGLQAPGVPLLFNHHQAQAAQPEWFPFEEVLHFKGFSTDAFMGVKVIDAARMNLGTSQVMEQYQRRFFTKGRPLGFIAKAGQLTADQRDEIRQEWKEIFETVQNAYGVGVLGGDSKWVPMGYTNDDAQLLQNKAFSVLDVARWLRIPPHMLGELTKATEVNIEELMLEFITFTLLPWIVRHEEEMNLKLFTPRESTKYEVFYDVNAFLRGDAKTAAEVEEKDIRNGVRTLDEVRLAKRLNPYPDELGAEPLIIASQLDMLRNVKEGTSLLHGQAKPAPASSKSN